MALTTGGSSVRRSASARAGGVGDGAVGDRLRGRRRRAAACGRPDPASDRARASTDGGRSIGRRLRATSDPIRVPGGIGGSCRRRRTNPMHETLGWGVA